MADVTYDSRAIRIDGRRTLLISGSIHYPRSTPRLWPALLDRSREAGLNTIETYVFWNLHERRRGVLDFSGRLDLVRFLELVAERGMHAILRIGPYVCAETNYGGFPAWLRDVPGVRMRTANEPFQREMGRFVRDVVERVRPLLAPAGGPVVLTQIENEYDLIAKHYGDAGRQYLDWCLDLTRRLELGIPTIMCVGAAAGAIETINAFHAHTQIDKHFASHPDQPALWTEHWPGWYDIWGCPRHRRTPQEVAYASARFVAAGGTGINYYMWHGGTNFDRESMYLQATSYDFDAPLDEHGCETTKSRHLGRLHGILQDHAHVLLAAERPAPEPLGEGQVAYDYRHAGRRLTFLCNDADAAATVAREGGTHLLPARSVTILMEGVRWCTAELGPAERVRRVMVARPQALSAARFWKEPAPPHRGDGAEEVVVRAAAPVEQLRLTRDESDYCWYTTALRIAGDEPVSRTLTLEGVADLAYVFLDGELVAQAPAPPPEERGALDGAAFTQRFELSAEPGTHDLSILCCALGLIKGDWQIGGANMAEERKGLWGRALWGDAPLTGWTMRPGLVGERCGLFGPAAELAGWNRHDAAGRGKPLTWWRLEFDRPEDDLPLALDLHGMTKGLAFLNGRCIGRYWLVPAGPQEFWGASSVELGETGIPTQRYYRLPGEWLRERNVVTLFDEGGGDPAQIELCQWRES